MLTILSTFAFGTTLLIAIAVLCADEIDEPLSDLPEGDCFPCTLFHPHGDRP